MTELSTAPPESAHTPRQPAVEPWTLIASTSVLGVLLVAAEPVLGGTAYGWAVITVTAVLSLRLAHVDERTYMLPNRLTGALAAFGVIQAIGISWLQQDFMPLITGAISAGIVTTVYAILAIIGSSGFGDIKFAGALTLTIAPYAGFLALYLLPIAFVISALRAMGRKMRGQTVKHPHGASIAIAGIVIVVGAMVAGPAFPLP